MQTLQIIRLINYKNIKEVVNLELDLEKMKKDNEIQVEIKEGQLTEYTYVMLRSAVAQTIIGYRKKMGYTQEDLANMLNVSQARIAKLENGINITLKTLCDINEKLENKEYSFILEVLNNLQLAAKKIRRANYYFEINKILDNINWNYSNKVEEKTYDYDSKQKISYSNLSEIQYA